MLPEAEQAARSSASPSSTPDSPSLAPYPDTARDLNHGHSCDQHDRTQKPWRKAAPQSRYSKAAPDHAEQLRGHHLNSEEPRGHSDDEAPPDLISNDSDSSPAFSPSSPDVHPGPANGSAFSCSAQSSPSHGRSHGRSYDQSPDSDDSHSSPRIRHWPNGSQGMSAADTAAGSAPHDQADCESSAASDELHQDSASSPAGPPDTRDRLSQKHSFIHPQTQQSLNMAAAHFQEGFQLLCRREWRPAVCFVD